MSSTGIVCYPKDDMDSKRKMIQLTNMCFPFSDQQVAATEAGIDHIGSAIYREPTPPLPVGAAFAFAPDIDVAL